MEQKDSVMAYVNDEVKDRLLGEDIKIYDRAWIELKSK